jgi:nickel transport protein
MKLYLTLSIILLFMTLIPSHTAYAHRVIFFAWVEDGQIHTEGSFPGKKKAKNCQVIVTDEQGRIIHEGKTDDQGRHSFKIPADVDSDLILSLKAGEGHQGEWRIPRAELSGHSPTLKPDKEKLQSGPSALKIISGIVLIFLLAGLAKLFLRKQKA